MRIQPITSTNYYRSKKYPATKNNNNISFHGKFLPKGIKPVDILLAVSISAVAPGIGAGYLVTKYLWAKNSEDN